MAERRKIFNGQFTIGNLITIVIIVGGLAAGWGAFGSNINHNAAEITDTNCEIDNHVGDTRVHYMVGSPMEAELKCLNEKLERLTEEVIRLRIAIEKDGG